MKNFFNVLKQKSFKITSIADFISINFLLFLILFAWSKFVTKNIISSLFISLIILIIFNFVSIFFKSKKASKLKISRKLQEDIKNYSLTLLSSSDKENLLFFNQLLNDKNAKVNIKENFLMYFNSKNELCFLTPQFKNKDLDITSALKQISKAIKLNATNVFVICDSVENKIKVELEKIGNINVYILDKTQTFLTYYRKYNYYPKLLFSYKNKSKIKFKEVLYISFNKKKSKKYFFSGLFIFFCSFFVRLNIYYVIFSSILFSFSILSLKISNKTYKNEKINFY